MYVKELQSETMFGKSFKNELYCAQSNIFTRIKEIKNGFNGGGEDGG